MQLNLSLSLLGAAALLALMATRLRRRLAETDSRLMRALGILFGGTCGVSAALPLAVLMNPLVGLQRSTFYNLAILAMCLSFLGAIVGSLGGLAYSGMILSTQPRKRSSAMEGTPDALEEVAP